MDSYALLEKLCNVPGIPGFEDEVREMIVELVKPLVDDVRVDALGSVIATRRGRTDFKLMLDAHMDEIGFMVQHIDADGFIRFTPIGGWDARLLPSHAMTIITRERKRVEGVIGTRPPHILKPAERESVIHVEDMFLDIGVSSRQEALALGVRVGDPIVIMYPARRIGADTIMSKALDDRAGCGVVIKALEALKGETVDATIYAAFVIAEERGLIGARTTAFSIAPEMAIALEGTVAADSPGIPPQGQPTMQGQGPAITVADGGFVVPRKMVMAFEKAAEDNRIPYQTKVPPYGGTDATAIHQTRGGVLTGVISVPCRYIHSPFSTCRLTDFDNTWRLLAAFCRVATAVT